MELINLWTVIRRWWWLILLPTVIALVLALPSLRDILSPAIRYNVVMRFTASQPPSPQAQTFEDQSYIPWLASEYVIINLMLWTRTESFAREIVDVLRAENVTLDIGAVRGALNSDSVRSVLTLYLDWPDAAQIEQMARAAVRVLRERSQAYFPQLNAVQIAITPLDEVVVGPVGAPITARLTPLLRVLIGLAAGVGLAFLAEYLDPRLRTRREVEGLGLPVIAEIPKG